MFDCHAMLVVTVSHPTLRISLPLFHRFISQYHVNIIEIKLIFYVALKCILAIKSVLQKSQYSLE